MIDGTFDQAFRRLFTERAASLYRYLFRLSGDVALSVEITQECFVRLYRSGRLPDAPAAWLVSTAHDLLHRRYLADEEPQSVEPVPTTDAAALAADLMASAHRALARLPERDRRLLLLQHEGYEYRDIAEIEQLAPGGVGTMLARVSDEFRRTYDELQRTPD